MHSIIRRVAAISAGPRSARPRGSRALRPAPLLLSPRFCLASLVIARAPAGRGRLGIAPGAKRQGAVAAAETPAPACVLASVVRVRRDWARAVAVGSTAP